MSAEGQAAGGDSAAKGNLAEEWKLAKAQAKKLGYIPASFSTAVRTLVQDQYNNDAMIRPVTKYQVARLLKTPSFTSMFYHCTANLRSGFIRDAEVVTVGSMMDLFDPIDLAAFIGCFLYHRKCRKLMGDDWSKFEASFREASMISAQVGSSMPELGIGACFLVETFKAYGLCALYVDEAEKRRKYENIVRKGEMSPEDAQRSIWGCTSIQVSVFLMSGLGFGVDLGNAFSTAHDPTTKLSVIEKGSLNFRYKIAALWNEAVEKGIEQPVEKVPGEYYPMSAYRVILDEEVAKIKGGEPHWLSSKKEDISPEKAPGLFAQREVSEEIPEELQDVFSMEEITDMEELAFDDLIDQIDADNEAADSGKLQISDKELGEIEDLVS